MDRNQENKALRQVQEAAKKGDLDKALQILETKLAEPECKKSVCSCGKQEQSDR